MGSDTTRRKWDKTSAAEEDNWQAVQWHSLREREAAGCWDTGKIPVLD